MVEALLPPPTTRHPRGGYDAGKKVNGRKRFIVTDTLGLLLIIWACAASVGRLGGRPTADDGPGRSQARRATRVHRHPETLGGRTHAGLDHRPPPAARDYERHLHHSEAMIRWAAINTMTRRITRGHPAARPGRRPLEYTNR